MFDYTHQDNYVNKSTFCLNNVKEVSYFNNQQTTKKQLNVHHFRLQENGSNQVITLKNCFQQNESFQNSDWKGKC